jgi:hypothetical protein
MTRFSPLSDHAAEAIVGGLIRGNDYNQGSQFRNSFRNQNNSTSAVVFSDAVGGAVDSTAANANFDERQVYAANGNNNVVFSFAL